MAYNGAGRGLGGTSEKQCPMLCASIALGPRDAGGMFAMGLRALPQYPSEKDCTLGRMIEMADMRICGGAKIRRREERRG